MCADMIRLVLAEHELVVGEVVLKELERVLTRKIELPVETIQEIIAFLEQQPV